MKGIVLHSVLPVRAAAEEESEQLTQLLFGETVTILQEEGRWTKVENDYDGQVGWVDFKMITTMTDEEYAHYCTLMEESCAYVRMPMAFAMSQNNQQTIPLTAGTRLAGYCAPENGMGIGSFEVLGVKFSIDPGMVITQTMPVNKESLMALTRFFLNVPYLWGGKNALGMDCSGLTQVVFSLMGVRLKRNAGEQITQGKAVESLSEAQAGDLVFFDKNDHITHVGILLEKDVVLHCSGRVKVEKIDEEGILSSENNRLYKVGEHTHHLCAIRRYGED